MVSETVHDLTPSRGGRLTTTLRDHWLVLLLAWLCTTVVAFGALYVLLDAVLRDVVALASTPDGTEVVVASPWSLLVLQVELATAAGFAVVALLVTGFVFRDAPSDVGREVTDGPVVGWLAVAGLLFGGGVVFGSTVVVPVVVDILASGQLATGFRPSVHLIWTAELAIFLPVVVGVTLSLPALLVAGVRSGAVRPQTLGARWPVALLGAVLVGAFCSPPDSVTFALTVGLLLGGYGVGTTLASSIGRRR